MLVLLPKFPMCIAAYITVWTGAAAAAPIAGHLRLELAGIFVVSLTFLLVRRLLIKTECRSGGWNAQGGGSD
jgi:hypothetical protein